MRFSRLCSVCLHRHFENGVRAYYDSMKAHNIFVILKEHWIWYKNDLKSYGIKREKNKTLDKMKIETLDHGSNGSHLLLICADLFKNT